jgi:hypothetical protein
MCYCFQLCSGQSNMQFAISGAFNATAEIAAAQNFPYIRLYSALQEWNVTPQVCDGLSDEGVFAQLKFLFFFFK